MKTVEVTAYHDETRCEEGNWLYHAFILVPREVETKFRTALAKRRKEVGCTQRVHYSKLSGAQGTRYRLATLWAKDHTTIHLGLGIRFSLLGLEMPKLTFQFRPEGALPKDIVIYNWAWRISLTGALAYLFEKHERVRLVGVYRELSDLAPCDRSLTTALRKISTEGRNFEVATGACRMIDPSTSDEIQLVDIIAGAHRQNIEGSSKAAACKNISKLVREVTYKLMTNPYNKNSRFFKHYSISFYPKQTQAVLGDGTTVSARDFYHNRTLKGCNAQQSFGL